MAADGFNDSWDELCLVGVMSPGGTEVQFAGMTEDITEMAWGEKDIEGKPLVNGGRVVRRVPMTDESITLKIYPVSADMDGTGAIQHMHPQGTNPTTSSITKPINNDVTDPIEVLNSNLRNKWRLVILWATRLPAAASTVPDASAAAYRIEVINAYVTKYTPSFDDKQMSAEVTFKWAPFKKDNTPNKRESSTDGSAQLSAVTTSATSWA